MSDNHDTFPVGIDSQLDALWIDCYVRSDPSPPLVRQIESVRSRLETLQTSEFVRGFQIHQWPSQQQATGPSSATQLTRDELVAEFNDWATEHGYVLSPAFQHQTIPSSPLGYDDPRDQLRVPCMALALYEEQSRPMPPQGVVPYTVPNETGEHQTYTVTQWLNAVETIAQSQQHSQLKATPG